MILFGLAAGLGNSIFCLPAIKALSRLDEVTLWCDADYPIAPLFDRCRYAAHVLAPGNDIPKHDAAFCGHGAPAAFNGLRFLRCGFPHGTTDYRRPEWEQIKLAATGNGEREDVSDWIDIPETRRIDRDFALIPGAKPGAEWERKKWGGFRGLAYALEDGGYTCEASGKSGEIAEAWLGEWWRGEKKLEALPEALLRCRVAVTTDSGVGHLASSLGIPCVMLFTATSPVKGQPLGPHRIITGGCEIAPRGCQSTPTWKVCTKWVCREISVAEVAHEAVGLLPRTISGMAP